MKIGNYAVKMTSNHSAEEVKTLEENLRYWSGNNTTKLAKTERRDTRTINNSSYKLYLKKISSRACMKVCQYEKTMIVYKELPLCFWGNFIFLLTILTKL